MNTSSVRPVLKTLALAALLATGAAHAEGRYVLISHAPDSDSWWNTIKNSVKQAGEDYGVTVDYRNPANGDLADMARLIEQAAAQNVDGVITTIADFNVLQGARMAGANKIIGVDINPDREEWGRRFGMTDFLNSKGLSREDTVAKIVEMTDGGADYTFDATGNTEVMRTALEACHRGWGTSIIIGVAEAGKEISTRPFQLVTGRNWRGTAFGGAKGRTDVPQIVDMYMTGKIEIDPMITHVMGLEEINTAFDLMHAGKSIRSVVVF